jgi:hypothetical protein
MRVVNLALKSKTASSRRVRRGRLETFGLSQENLRTLRALKTPMRIQKFVDAME